MAWYPYTLRVAWNAPGRGYVPAPDGTRSVGVYTDSSAATQVALRQNGQPVDHVRVVGGRATFEADAAICYPDFGDGPFYAATDDPAAVSDAQADAAVARAADAGTVLTPAAGDAAYARMVDVAAHGVVADGATDDAAALSSAAQTAATFGLPLVLPAGKTIRLGSRVDLPAGLTLHTNGAKFTNAAQTGDYLLTLAANTRIIGALVIERTAGGNVRGVTISGNGVHADGITVTSPVTGAGAGDLNDLGVNIAGSDVRIGALTITNFDYAVKVGSSSRVRIDRLDITGYVRGLYVTNTVDLSVAWGVIRTASPNAAVSPGHNGVLIDATAHDATRDLRFTGVTVRDAGEHGWRIGGNKRVRRVWFTDCAAINVGGCGLKALGGTTADNNYHEYLWVTSFVVEDAGQTTENAAGVQLEFVKHAKVTDLIVRKNTKTYSAGFGVQIQAAENVTVLWPSIDSTLVACYAVRATLGNCTLVKLVGGVLGSGTGDGVLIDYSGRTFRRVSVEGHPQIEVLGYSVNVVNTSGGAITGSAWLTWQSVNAASVQYAGTLAGYFCDVRAGFTGDPAFKDGSMWTDTLGTIRVRNGGAWKALTLAA